MKLQEFEKKSGGKKIKMMTKNPTCPSCKSKNTCQIFWGFPEDMEWYLEAIAKKEISPGGCTLTDNDPKWNCNNCSNRWGRRDEN